MPERTKACTRCLTTKPFSEFYNNPSRRDGKVSHCKECMKEQQRSRREYYTAKTREWRKTNPERTKEHREAYRPRKKEREKATVEQRRTQRNAWNKRMQDAAIDAYGGFCACCGETERTFLQLDHVNDDGAAHRRELKGRRLAPWLRKMGYPDGFRVLCANCNFGRHLNGGVCPHAETVGQVIP